MRRSERARARLLVALLGAACAALVQGCPESRDAGNPANVATSGAALTAAEVDRLLLGAVEAAQRENAPMAVAITDREGEVLGVFVTTSRDTNADGRLEVPGEANIQAAIAKAATAAAFQSEGEAFTTRTAFFIVQGHFPPNVPSTGGGPLFGVQDSSQPSSDVRPLAYSASGQAVGSGISGVLGGVPLYKLGSPVGGIGVDVVAAVTSQGTPLAATLAVPIQRDQDERIALAAIPPEMSAPSAIQATNVYVDGIAFPFAGGAAGPGTGGVAPTTSSLPAGAGAIDARFPVRASPLPAEVRQDSRYGLRAAHRYVGRVTARSSATFTGAFTNVDRPAGVSIDPTTLGFTNVPIASLPQAPRGGQTGEARHPSIDGVEPPPAEGGLTRSEVDRIIDRAVTDASGSIAGIRLPRGSRVTVHVAVVDRRGNLLGLHRMADGTLFSADVAVQKARTAAFFSADGTEGLPPVALTPRAIGFLAQPFFPPGIEGTFPGPLARLRDLINRGKVTLENPPSLTLIAPPPRPPSDGTTDEDVTQPGNQTFNDYGGAPPAALAAARSVLSLAGGIALTADRPDTTPQFVSPGLQSGLQTFPGGVPLFRNGKLVGGVGVSGDGVDEDDAASFAGAFAFEPPAGVRCDDATEAAIVQVLSAKVDLLVAAVRAHPDARVRDVYTPIIEAERGRIRTRLAQGLQGVRIPYVKLPRNPQNR